MDVGPIVEVSLEDLFHALRSVCPDLQILIAQQPQLPQTNLEQVLTEGRSTSKESEPSTGTFPSEKTAKPFAPARTTPRAPNTQV